MSMSLVLGWGAYARDKNTSARLCAKKAGGLMREGGVYLRDTTVYTLGNQTVRHQQRVEEGVCMGETYHSQWHITRYSQPLASFPGLPTVQFLIAWSMQKREGEGLVSFYHMNDVSVYLGRQRGGGIPCRKNKLEA